MLDTDALIHVLEFVANWHCVMLQIMCQHVHVHLDILVIHSCNAVNNRVSLRILIHAHHHHADQTAIVAIIMDRGYAHVQLDTLVRHHNVDRNVLFHRNVQQIELVLIRNALIHVHTLVASVQSAMLAITIQFALVHPALLAIHSHNAQEFVRFYLFFFHTYTDYSIISRMIKMAKNLNINFILIQHL